MSVTSENKQLKEILASKNLVIERLKSELGVARNVTEKEREKTKRLIKAGDILSKWATHIWKCDVVTVGMPSRCSCGLYEAGISWNEAKNG